VSKKATLPMMPFYVRDWIAGTRELTPAERGVYIDLLCLEWDSGGPLNKDLGRLAGMVSVSKKQFRALWRKVKNKFELLPAGYINARLEEERQAAIARRQKTSEKASNAALKRWEQRAGADAPSNASSIRPPMLGASAKQCLDDALQSPPPHPHPDSGGVLEDSDSLPQKRTARPKQPAYEWEEFHQKVLGAYHELVPDMPRVMIWSKERRQALDARIRECCKRGKPADSLDYWRAFFTNVAASDFLCGRKTDFCASLDWLLKPKNFIKVIEGHYENRGSNGGAHAR
jgi:uncharacterized protein YdaU (DUF1376 family)